MSHEIFKNIRKKWKSGNYNSKREVVNAFLTEKNINPNTTDKNLKETIYVINRIAENVIQGGDGLFWRK